MRIVLVGKGNMAEAIRKVAGSQGITVESLDAVMKDPLSLAVDPHVVAIHVGSGRELPALIELCRARQIPLLQGATKIEPQDYTGLVVVDAPNFSLPMVRFLEAFPPFMRAIMPSMQPSVIESHQAGKADVSGTARKIVAELGISEDVITSVRDVPMQRLLGIPEWHLDGHGYHQFRLSGGSVEFVITTTVLGRETYAEGALAMAKALYGERGVVFAPGVYNVTNMLQFF